MSEILTLRWEHVDLERRCLRLPDSKSGAKVVHLNGAAIGVLALLAREPSGWVLPGGKEGAHLVNLQKPWRRIRRQATWATSGCTTCGTASPRWPPGLAKGCT